MKTITFDLDGTLVQLKPNLVCFANIEALTLLRKQYNFALVSGSTKAEIMWALDKTGLRPLFDNKYIVALEDTNSEKISGRPFQVIRSRAEGIVVMIGDSASDEIGSAIAGLPFVRVKTLDTVADQQKELNAAIMRAINLIEQKLQKGQDKYF